MSIDLTNIRSPMGLLEPDTHRALIAHGGPYQIWSGHQWVDAVEKPSWDGSNTYRVKPGPIIVTHAYDAWLMPTGWVHAGKSMQEAQPVRIIFNRIDGAIDPSSYRVVPR